MMRQQIHEAVATEALDLRAILTLISQSQMQSQKLQYISSFSRRCRCILNLSSSSRKSRSGSIQPRPLFNGLQTCLKIVLEARSAEK
jgi:hypothetical protein